MQDQSQLDTAATNDAILKDFREFLLYLLLLVVLTLPGALVLGSHLN